MTKKFLGRIDKFDFPSLNLSEVEVKIDTGAYTSAIHCSEIVEKGKKLVCTFQHKSYPNFGGKTITFQTFKKTDVKSSNGVKENRYKIKTEVIVYGKKYKISLTLSTRDDMRFPVLIGRQFLSKKFMVDVDQEYLSLSKKPREVKAE